MQRMNNYFRARASMVYMMTNNEVMNHIVAFHMDTNGMLTFVGSYRTYGRGTGIKEVSTETANDGIDPLASQGSLTFPVMVVSYLQLTQAVIVSVVLS